jgi:hypothetical protein
MPWLIPAPQAPLRLTSLGPLASPEFELSLRRTVPNRGGAVNPPVRHLLIGSGGRERPGYTFGNHR